MNTKITVHFVSEFFTQHLGPFSDVFNSLEGIGNSVTNALMDCHSVTLFFGNFIFCLHCMLEVIVFFHGSMRWS